MNNYADANRGTFQSEEYAKQLVSFEGMRFTGRNGINNVTPTDIDGLVQLDAGNCVIFFELKHSGGLPAGQANALKKLADCARAGGAESIVFVATHKTEYPETIYAKDAIVTAFYWRGKWYRPNCLYTLYNFMLRFAKWAKEKKQYD